MKKIQITLLIISIIILIAICIFSMLYLVNSALKKDKSTSDSTTQITYTSEATAQAETSEFCPTASTTLLDDKCNISAPYAGLYNASTGEIVYEKNSDSKIHPASLTKILTAITALTYMDASTVITVGSEQNLIPERSSLCLIQKGHRLILYDLLTGMLVSSGNDAAYAIAVNVAQLVANRNDMSDKEALSYFIELMNSIAKTIGADNSNFTTPDGFDSENQYTCINDLATICRYALKFKEIREIVSTTKKKVFFKSGENVVWINSNRLLDINSPYYFSQATGMKTGTTPLAGKCLIATADINSQTYIAIVAGCNSDDQRYKSVMKLFDFASTI